PETVESLFLAWRLTGNKRYRDYAWGIFEAIEKHCRLAGGGYATVLDVDTVPVRHEDKQETFYL
ncbi:glycoside hydrolase, partial [Mycena leptocephala]